MQNWNLPEGVTMEQLDAYAMQKERERRQKWRLNHPDKLMQQRINASRNLLRRSGFDVIPKLPPLPWNELQQRCILQALQLNAEKEGVQ